MAQEIGSWLAAGLLGALGGMIYWLIADQMLGIVHGSLTERLAVGTMVGMAVQVVRRLQNEH